MIVLLVAAAGGAGAVLRVLTDGLVTDRPLAGRRFPGGTLTVNLVGSFLLGLLAGLVPGESAVLGVGLLGGYTTFSTFAVQTVRLPLPLAACNVLLNVVGCVGAAALGLSLAT